MTAPAIVSRQLDVTGICEVVREPIRRAWFKRGPVRPPQA